MAKGTRNDQANAKKHLIIWRADANGQIGEIKHEEEKQRRIIGPHTKQKGAEKGNGKQVTQICYAGNMIPMNTWKTPPLTKEEKYEIKQSYEPWKTRQHIQHEHTNTWISPNGQIARQIGYIMINQKYRNAVKRARAEQARRGNMAQQRQHATIILDTTLKLARKYHMKPLPETGKN